MLFIAFSVRGERGRSEGGVKGGMKGGVKGGEGRQKLIQTMHIYFLF